MSVEIQLIYGHGLSTLASKLELSISETVDLLYEFENQSLISFDDYLKGFEVFQD